MATVLEAPQITASEHEKRDRRKGSYHLVASKNRLPKEEDEYEDQLFQYLMSSQPGQRIDYKLRDAKAGLLRDLASSGGAITTPGFKAALEQLSKLYDASQFDARTKPPKKPSSSRHRREQQPPVMEGMWITLTKPAFKGCLGQNYIGDYMYTLGRMSFDMFRPTKLVCSIQGTFNPIHVVSSKHKKAIKHVPKTLAEEARHAHAVLRTYDIVTAFAIEPYRSEFGPTSPNREVARPIEGLLTTYGYVLPNPEKPNRLSVWFTGGTIEVNLAEDTPEWKSLFASETLPKRRIKEKARVFGAKLAVGAQLPEKMEEDGKMSYHLTRPIGGHETSAYIELLYLDETLRIARSGTGEVYVFARVPFFPDE